MKAKGILLVVFKIVLLFCLEAVLQSLYFAISMKYFDEYSGTLFNDFSKNFFDSIYALLIYKAVFYLPFYLLFDPFVFLMNGKRLIKALIHASFFLVISSVLLLLLPDALFKDLNLFPLSIIAFISAYISLAHFSPQSDANVTT